MELSRKLKILAAKSDKENADLWLPLYVHAVDTAELMRSLLRNWVPEAVRRVLAPDDVLAELGTFLGLIHDFGKATAAFQSLIAPMVAEQTQRLETAGYGCYSRNSFLNAGRTPHALMSEIILETYFSVPPSISIIAGSHHGKPPGIDNDCELLLEVYGENFYSPEPERKTHWEKTWQEYFDFSMTYSGFKAVSDLPAVSVEAQLLLTGLLIMADWLASNTGYYPLLEAGEMPTLQQIKERGKKAWKKIALPDCWEPGTFVMDVERFRTSFGFLPNDVQQEVLNTVNSAVNPGILILEAPMGVGKTEAALAAAEVFSSNAGAGGLYFGLPTQATSNAIFSRLMDWAANRTDDSTLSMRLAHGMFAMNDTYRGLAKGSAAVSDDSSEGKLIAHEWFEGSKQALLANFVAGTVDQLLMASLKQKHVMLRHLGLAGKVVIVDECHAYDAYMNVYLERSLSWLGAYGVPVIILSATLPVERRAALVDAYLKCKGKPDKNAVWRSCSDYPLITWTDGTSVQQTAPRINSTGTVVSMSSCCESELAAILKTELTGGGCAGIIVNTVKKAQRLAHDLKNALPDAEVVLFHSQFVSSDRVEKEKLLLEQIGKHSVPVQRDHLIIVGTQVLEQSLDIDFDILFTEPAPMDLILQRLGRLHRHIGRQRPANLMLPRCFLLKDENGEPDRGTVAVYGKWLLYQTEKLLPTQIRLPEDISPLVQAAYAAIPDEAESEERELYLCYREEIEKRKSAADAYCIAPPAKRNNPRKTITGFLEETVGNSRKAEAAVRDGDASVEVLLVVEHADGFGLLPWIDESRTSVPSVISPPEEIVEKLIMSRLRLPHALCTQWNISRTIEELEKKTNKLAPWQTDPRLKGELFLILDECLQTELCDFKLIYSQTEGLCTQKEE